MRPCGLLQQSLRALAYKFGVYSRLVDLRVERLENETEGPLRGSFGPCVGQCGICEDVLEDTVNVSLGQERREERLEEDGLFALLVCEVRASGALKLRGCVKLVMVESKGCTI